MDLLQPVHPLTELIVYYIKFIFVYEINRDQFINKTKMYLAIYCMNYQSNIAACHGKHRNLTLNVHGK